MRADRLLTLLGLLRRHGRLTSAQLAERLEVDRRTVLRDLTALSASGVPVITERGRGGGVSLMPGYRPDVEDLTADEARALFLAGGDAAAEALGVRGALASAMRKLSSRLPEDTERELGRLQDLIIVDAPGWHDRDPPPREFGIVQTAVLEGRRLVLDYTPRDPADRGRRTVDPLGMVFAGSTWYLVATHRRVRKTFRIERINRATLLPDRVRRPEGFDLRQSWSQIRDGYRDADGVDIAVEVPVDRVQLVRRLMSINLLGAVTEESRDGRTVQLMRVRSLRGAVAILLGFGDLLTVIDPPELRALMVEVAEQAISAHT